MAFDIIRNDITKMNVDAIVNAANSSLAPGGGVCGAIFDAAGYEKMEMACEAIGHCDVGNAVITSGFDLSAKYVIHAVGPIWQGGDQGEEQLLRNCYRNALLLAKEKGCRSVAFPLISSGIYGYPKSQALKCAMEVISEFLFDHDLEVTLVIFDSDSMDTSKKIFADVKSYINDTYIGDRSFQRRRHKESFFHTKQRNEQKICREMVHNSQLKHNENTQGSLDPYISPQHDEQIAYSESICPYDLPIDDSSEVESLSEEFLGEKEDSIVCFMAAPPIEDENPLTESAKCASVPPKKKLRSLIDIFDHKEETFSRMLLRLIEEKGLSDAEAYKRAHIDRRLFSKIRSNKDYAPSKNTVISFAIALGLNLDQAKDLLKTAGYALSHSNVSDIIVEYFISHEIYDIFELNETLFYFDQKILS